MQNADCEVLILSAEPVGLSMALAAARYGKPVIILDDNPRPGGQIWCDGPQVSLPRHAGRLRQAVAEHPHVTLLSGAQLITRPGPHSVVFEVAGDCGEICWQRLILCCGTRELSLLFLGWTLPNVTGVEGLQTQTKHGLQSKGECMVIVGSGPLLLVAASAVKRAGGNIVIIIEQTPMSALTHFVTGLWRWPEKLRQFGELFPARYHPTSQVIQTQGNTHLQSVTVRHQRQTRKIACDRLTIGYGPVSGIEPGATSGCKTENQIIWVDAEQHTSVQDIYAAGECTSSGDSELTLAEGEVTNYATTNCPQKAQDVVSAHARWQYFVQTLRTTLTLSESLRAVTTVDMLLCRCEDIRCGGVRNVGSWQAVKLASRRGMGVCQGKVCAISARRLCGWPLSQPREPLSPTCVDTLIHLAKPKR